VGPVRFLKLEPAEGGLDSAKRLVPNSRIVIVEPAPGRLGVNGPTPVLEYDMFVYTNADAPDEAVAGMIDALVMGKDELTQLVPSFAFFDPATMAAQIGVPYHPA